MLEKYAKSLEHGRPQDLDSCITLYSEQRKKAYDVHFANEAKLKELEKEREKIQKKHNKAWKPIEKEKMRESRKRQKELERKNRARQEKRNGRDRLKQERLKFWPRKVYRIVLSLDTNPDLTPASSRRGSIDSLAKTLSEDSFSSSQISLSVSYITHSAWWSPHYDLSLSTPTSTGTILYRAEFGNTTSETWKDAKIILSTSQTAFQGLGDPVPSMQPWHIRLDKDVDQYADSTEGALLSMHELEIKERSSVVGRHGFRPWEPRSVFFGLGKNFVPSNLLSAHLDQEPQQGQHQVQLQQQRQQMLQSVPQQVRHTSLFGAPVQQMHAQSNAGGLFGNSQPSNGGTLFGNSQPSNGGTLFGNSQPSNGGGLFGNNSQPSNGGGLFGNSQQVPAQPTGDTLFGSSSRPSQSGHNPQEIPSAQHSAPTEDVNFDNDGVFGSNQTIVPETPSLVTQESEWSETGMTATYDIPGRRTIAPSDTMRRHKIAAIELKTVHLSYLLVPRLRAAAFLKARIRNSSSIALLKGPAGLTLDGTFLGNSSLPRCSADESFSLSLGVDPSVTVTYSKPVVKRSQTGVFQKEGTGVYTRTCTVTNTRPDRPLEAIVLDQVPVSEDERLKVDILQPAGLRNENDSVAKTGSGIAAVGKVTEKWGTAKATLKKAGEVSWKVNLEPGRGVKLVLEYEARFPSNEVVTSC